MSGQEVRVLLVDDHADMLSMMGLVMKRRSYQVATAISADQALELAEGFGPDVIISDIGMPGMDGYQLMATLRSMDRISPFRAIALSGYGQVDDHERALAAGYDTHLTKPVDFEELFATIDELAGSVHKDGECNGNQEKDADHAVDREEGRIHAA